MYVASFTYVYGLSIKTTKYFYYIKGRKCQKKFKFSKQNLKLKKLNGKIFIIKICSVI